MKINRNIYPLLLIVLLTLGFSSCGDTINPEKVEFPEQDVSYIRHVEPFMRANCAYYGCHGVNSPGEEISDYFTLITALSYIVPGKPNNSLVNQILEGRLPHPGTYPVYFGNITDNQIQGMRLWVEEGAKNN